MVLWILTAFARVRLARMRRGDVKVIGITGSIGKTTCKEAVAHVLRGSEAGESGGEGRHGSRRVLNSEKSYNTEFGLPLTILELKSEFSSVVGWVKNLGLAVWRGMFARTEYDFLILEMGVDKPGDMDQLIGVLRRKSGAGAEAPLDCAVFTGVHPVHMADGQFADMNAIAEEKGKIMGVVRGGSEGGVALINGDDERGRRLADAVKRRSNAPNVIVYGASEGAKFRVSEVRSGWDGLDFVVTYGEVRGAFHVPILGKQHIGSLLPAIGCGLMMGMYMSDIVEQMRTFVLPPGRLSYIEGVNGSRIIDSSYNASPDAVRAAVNTVGELAEETESQAGAGGKKFSCRKIFVLGNMNELGAVSEKEHREIGAYIKGKIDVLITVGDMARLAAGEANGVEVASFDDALEAAEYLKPKLQKGDIVLVKGSQNKVRLERLVKVIMKDPSQAKRLLARQDWADA